MDFNQDDLGVRRVLGNCLAGATYENKPAIATSTWTPWSLAQVVL